MSHSESETELIASAFAKTLHGGEVILLDGDLGAGKTAFVRGLAKGLGVRDRITSPTFVLMRIHRIGRHGSRDVSREHDRRSTHLTPHASRLTPRYFVHVDAYRVRDTRDLEAIGLLEWVGRPDTVVVVEWGERVHGLFPHPVHRVSISSTTTDTTRTIQYH